MEGDPLNKVISLVVAAIVGLVLVIGAFLPIASGQISWAIGTHNEGTTDNPDWQPNIDGINAIMGGSSLIGALLSVVVIMVILGLIIGVVYYLRNDRY